MVFGFWWRISRKERRSGKGHERETESVNGLGSGEILLENYFFPVERNASISLLFFFFQLFNPLQTILDS